MRLFAAVELPGAVREALAGWGAEAAARAGDALRALPAESLHVTLAFLGWRGADEADAIGRLVLACGAPCRELSLGDALWLSPRRPHVLTVEVADPQGALAALQAEVARVLAAQAGYEPEQRAFRPHVTVARVRRGARVRPRELVLPPTPRASFAAPALTLFRSHLGRGGARYEPVVRVRLG